MEGTVAGTITGSVYYGASITTTGEPAPTLVEQIRQIVREELAAHTGRLEEKMRIIEEDLILSKQHMIQTVEAISSTFSTELDQLMDEYEAKLSRSISNIV